MSKHNSRTLEYRPEDGAEQVVETAEEPKTERDPVTGVVMGCTRLNLREQPDLNGTIICSIAEGSKVTIDEAESKADWYKVCAENGAQGYCMKAYVATNS